MSDTTRTDHAEAIAKLAGSLIYIRDAKGREIPPVTYADHTNAVLRQIVADADALAAERDALRTYALLLEGELYERVPDANEIISACRDEANVTAADLYETPPEGVQGGAM
jgi:hypothetical protein